MLLDCKTTRKDPDEIRPKNNLNENWDSRLGSLTFFCSNSIAASRTSLIADFKKTSRIRPPDLRGSKRRKMNSSKVLAIFVKSSSSGPFFPANLRSSKFICNMMSKRKVSIHQSQLCKSWVALSTGRITFHQISIQGNQLRYLELGIETRYPVNSVITL